jgi:predicted DNA-binding WGR domain protein
VFAQIDLEAINPLKKVDRYYTVLISPNLFGEIALQTIYGRNGTRGQKRTYTFSSDQECILKLNEILRKRLNAQGRLGTNYYVVDHTFDSEFKRDILEPLSLKETKDSTFKEALLNLKSKND